MAESTGRPAQTIAKLIADHLGEGKPDLPEHLLLIVDEASMVDLLSAYKLVGMLHQSTRIILVGDIAQLPPVGGGLVFHACMNTSIPTFVLTTVKRQGEQSGIHKLATGIRLKQYEKSQLMSNSGDVSYDPDSSAENIITKWLQTGGAQNSIILTPTRKGALGVDSVNKLIQEHIDNQGERPTIHYNDDLRGWIPYVTRTGATLKLGDQVLAIKNNYEEEAELRNGDLGTIIEIFEEPDKSNALAVVKIDSRLVYLKNSLLEYFDLGYAITIHKSQGSQWPTCVLLLPSYARHMIDQTLLYTAVTRPSQQLVILGDEKLIDAALERGAVVIERQTNLAKLLQNNE